jgi:hypothetical protein
MSPAEPRVFRTKTGTCTITADRIVLGREGLRGVAAQAWVGESSVGRPLMVYGALAALLALYGLRLVTQHQLAVGALLCIVALLLARAIVQSRGLSATPEIPRASIQRIEANRPRPLLTRGYFVVHFTEASQARKRLIILPGSLSGGKAEFEYACAVLKQYELLKSDLT